jgi:hypothetical protein
MPSGVERRSTKARSQKSEARRGAALEPIANCGFIPPSPTTSRENGKRGVGSQKPEGGPPWSQQPSRDLPPSPARISRGQSPGASPAPAGAQELLARTLRLRSGQAQQPALRSNFPGASPALPLAQPPARRPRKPASGNNAGDDEGVAPTSASAGSSSAQTGSAGEAAGATQERQVEEDVRAVVLSCSITRLPDYPEGSRILTSDSCLLTSSSEPIANCGSRLTADR